ncbi:DUF3027 domain-containing protein [Nocardia sp. NPDC004604]|uniref:DUF3027 domain-containing protein n=1 Tax=Nocardia sp. NPDC004604 TaxID=3157013 RepID=UPI0033B12EF1
MSAVSVSQSGVRPILADAVDVARRALLELEPTGVGAHLGVTAEDETAATHRFEATLSGYRGWQWAVVVAAPPDATYATVSESALLPGPDALVAPDFIPWEQRIRPGDLAPGDLLAPPVDDPRLVPGYVASGDPAVDEVAMEIGLGRTKVLSREGREAAAERWYAEFGPETDMAKAAPSTCGRCGFYLPLAGSLRAAFGVCGNAMGADGRVVHVEYGCGAHSDVEVPTGGGSPLYEAYDDDAFDVVPAEALRKPDSGAGSADASALATGPAVAAEDAETAASDTVADSAATVEQSVEVPNGEGVVAPSESTTETATDLTESTSVEPGTVPGSGDVVAESVVAGERDADAPSGDVAESVVAGESGDEVASGDAAAQSLNVLDRDVEAPSGDVAAESRSALTPDADTAASGEVAAESNTAVEQSFTQPDDQQVVEASEPIVEAASDQTLSTTIEPGVPSASADVIAEPRIGAQPGADTATSEVAADSNTAVEHSAPTTTSPEAVTDLTPAPAAEPIAVEPGDWSASGDGVAVETSVEPDDQASGPVVVEAASVEPSTTAAGDTAESGTPVESGGAALPGDVVAGTSAESNVVAPEADTISGVAPHAGAGGAPEPNTAIAPTASRNDVVAEPIAVVEPVVSDAGNAPIADAVSGPSAVDDSSTTPTVGVEPSSPAGGEVGSNDVTAVTVAAGESTATIGAAGDAAPERSAEAFVSEPGSDAGASGQDVVESATDAAVSQPDSALGDAEAVVLQPDSARAAADDGIDGAAVISDATGEAAPDAVATESGVDAAAVERGAEAVVSEPGAGAVSADQDVVESGTDASDSGTDAAVSQPGSDLGDAEGVASQSESGAEAVDGAADDGVADTAAGAEGGGSGDAGWPGFGSALQG